MTYTLLRGTDPLGRVETQTVDRKGDRRRLDVDARSPPVLRMPERYPDGDEPSTAEPPESLSP